MSAAKYLCIPIRDRAAFGALLNRLERVIEDKAPVLNASAIAVAVMTELIAVAHGRAKP